MISKVGSFTISSFVAGTAAADGAGAVWARNGAALNAMQKVAAAKAGSTMDMERPEIRIQSFIRR